MAKGTKELKRRMEGVKNIQQITHAMELVATQKLKRLQSRAEASRPYAEKIQQIVARLSAVVKPELSPLLQEREVHNTANLVVGSDRGLCGPYNTNLVRFVMREVGSGEGQATRVLGSKVTGMLEGKDFPLAGTFEDHVEKLDFIRVRNIVRDLVKDFLDEKVDEVRLYYTAFASAGSQVPTSVTLLPIRPAELLGEEEAGGDGEFIIEPSPEMLVQVLLPKFLEVRVYSAVLESLASEFSARRSAMKQATDAAEDMIVALRRQYNRARQETITKELLEIVSGAEALK